MSFSDTDSEEHEVETIVDHRRVGSINEYLVKWVGCPPSENSWEPECNLNDSALEDALDLKERKRAEAAAKRKAAPKRSSKNKKNNKNNKKRGLSKEDKKATGTTTKRRKVDNQKKCSNPGGGKSQSTEVDKVSPIKVDRKKYRKVVVEKQKQYGKICSADGCTNNVVNGGVCIKHGAKWTKKRCSVEGCTNQAREGGVCMKHGAKVKRCSSEGCTNQVQRGGVCWRHGAKKELKRCSSEGCTNQVQKGGVCIRHGAKVKQYLCSSVGCTNVAIKGGVCKKHGAKVKRCSSEGCTNQAREGGVCVKHGAKVKLCSSQGCRRQANKGGLCVRHGTKVKPKRCSREGCTKYAQNFGVCYQHFNELRQRLSEGERNIVPDWAVKQMLTWKQLVCNDDPRPVFGCDWCGPKIRIGYEGPFSVTSELCPSCEGLKSEGFSCQRDQSKSGKEMKVFYKGSKAVYLCNKNFLIGTTNTVVKKLGREASCAEAQAPAATEKESDLEIISRVLADTSADKEIIPDQRGKCHCQDQELTKNDEIHGNDCSSSQTIAREGSQSASLSETHSDEASTAVEIVSKGNASSEKETRRQPLTEPETEDRVVEEDEEPFPVDPAATAVFDGLVERKSLQQPRNLEKDSLPLEAQTETRAEEAYNTLRQEKDAVEGTLRDVQEVEKRLQSEIERYKKENNSSTELVAAVRRENDSLTEDLEDLNNLVTQQTLTTNTVCREKDAVEAALRDVQEEVKRLQSEIERYKKEDNSLKEENDAVKASLVDVQEDLDIQRDTTNQMLVTLGWWHRRFDKVSALAEAAGVDAAVLKSIRAETDGR